MVICQGASLLNLLAVQIMIGRLRLYVDLYCKDKELPHSSVWSGWCPAPAANGCVCSLSTNGYYTYCLYHAAVPIMYCRFPTCTPARNHKRPGLA